MIKDKIIQKRIKGKALAVAMTAFMASLFVPMVGTAAVDIPESVDWSGGTIDNSSFTATSTDITTGSGCMKNKKCTGHTLTGSVLNGTNGVTIGSGHHYIKLDSANITSAVSVLNVLSGAEVTLVLTGESTLTSNEAGIYVAQGATLNIMEEKDGSGTLKVGSIGEGAGIGGYGIGDASTAGTINIESGTIIAQGGDRSAGIGGSDRGTVENVKINGGCVVAKGGDGKEATLVGETLIKGAPGIGHGNAASGGDIVINGGQVTAIGGNDFGTKEHAAGISGTRVTSLSGGDTVIVSDGINAPFTTVNALVWDLKRNDDGKLVKKDGTTVITDFLKDVTINSAGTVDILHGNTCTVYGNVEMPANFPDDFNNQKNGKNTLVIPNGTSFKIPADLEAGFPFSGDLIAESNSTIVNPDQLHFQSGSQRVLADDMKYELSFNPEKDLKMKEGPFVYKGVAYQTEPITDNELFTVASRREVSIAGTPTQCRVDTSGLRCVYTWDTTKNNNEPSPDIEAEGVKNAGHYIATFIYGTKEHQVSFTIDPLDISKASGFTVDKIPDKEFRNREFVAGDFKQAEVVARFNNVELSANDYTWDTAGDKDVTDTAQLTIAGRKNFTGTRIVYYRIVPLAMNEENTVVELNNANAWKEEDGHWYVTYDSQQHMPDIKSVSVEVNETESIPLSGGTYDIVLSGSAETEESHYTDAGTITATITPKASNKNFSGECKKDFIIKPKQINVISVSPVDTERPYNGLANVKVTDIEVDLTETGSNERNIYFDRDGTAERPIEIPDSVEGTIAESDTVLETATVKTPNNTPYTQVWLDEDVCLAGKGGRNYSISGFYSVGNADEFILTEGILITPREAPTIQAVTGTAVPEEDNPPKFTCNMEIMVKEGDVIDPTSPIYLYKCEGEEEPPEDLGLWEYTTLDNMIYKNLSPNQSIKLYVMIGGTSNVAGTKTPFPSVVSIPKYPRKEGPSADDCTLTASDTPNENGETYKLTVEPTQIINEIYPEGRYLYSLSGEDGSYIGGDPSALFSDVAPKTEYTAYIKFAETDEYTESETGTPTNSVTTGEGVAQKPTISCGGATQSEGEIHFSGTASVSIEYPGKIPGYQIRYTLNGSQPTASSTLYEGPFEVSESVTVNAFVFIPNVASSEVTSVNLVRDGDSLTNPSSGMEVELQQLTQENTPTLIANTGLAGKWADEEAFKEISAELANPILQQRGYENNNITYADLKIKIKGTDRYATDEDFRNAEGGVIRVTVTMDQLKAIGLPQSYDATTHNFAVTHMFASGANAGNVEAIGSAHNFNRSQDGKSISFDLTSTSPVGFGWADVNNSDPMPVEPGEPGDDVPGSWVPESPDPGAQDPGNDPNALDADGEPRSADGDGTTTDTDAGTQGVSDDAANALSDIMPKTGDPLSFVPWIAAAVISVGAIVFFATRKTGKKKQTVKKTQAAKKKK